MALPVAPLGSLPSMNLPYSRQIYEKDSITNKAIAAFLANLAGNVGGQLGENVMQRDFGTESGGKDASIMSKFLSGPQVSRQQYEAQLGRKADADALAKQTASREGMAAADRRSQEGIADRRLQDAAEARLIEQTMQDMALSQRSQQAQYETERQRQMQEFLAGNRLTEIDREYGNREKLAKTNANEDRTTNQAKIDAEYATLEKRRQAFLGGQRGQTGGASEELTPEEKQALVQSSGQQKTTMQSMLDSPGGQILRFMTNPVSRIPLNVGVEPEQVPLQNPTGILPTPGEVVSGVPVETPVAEQPSTALAGSSLYEPGFDPLLLKIAEFMRNPRGQSSPQ